MSSIDAKWPETASSTSKWPAHRKHLYLVDFLKSKLTKFAVIWVKRRQKAGFMCSRSSKTTVTNRRNWKGKEKKKKLGERAEEKKKAMIALFAFIIVTSLDAKGPFSNNVVENPVRYINRCHYFFVVFLFFCSEICQVNNYKRRALYLLIVKSGTL